MDWYDSWAIGWIMGMVVGHLICYLFLFRPMMRLKDEYIAHLKRRSK